MAPRAGDGQAQMPEAGYAPFLPPLALRILRLAGGGCHMREMDDIVKVIDEWEAAASV
jgi:hypothetical protein